MPKKIQKIRSENKVLAWYGTWYMYFSLTTLIFKLSLNSYMRCLHRHIDVENRLYVLYLFLLFLFILEIYPRIIDSYIPEALRPVHLSWFVNIVSLVYTVFNHTNDPISLFVVPIICQIIDHEPLIIRHCCLNERLAHKHALLHIGNDISSVIVTHKDNTSSSSPHSSGTA